jgi:hypothetical protein
MNSLTKTQWLVLNATADDFENLEQIYRSMALEFSAERYSTSDTKAFYWRESADCVPLSEIVEAVRFLVDHHMLSIRLSEGEFVSPASDDFSYLWRAWFGITVAGRNALEEERKGE